MPPYQISTLSFIAQFAHVRIFFSVSFINLLWNIFKFYYSGIGMKSSSTCDSGTDWAFRKGFF